MTINPTISEPTSVSAVDFVREEVREALTPGQLVWRRFRKHRMAMLGAVGAILLVVFIIGGSIIVGGHASDIDLQAPVARRPKHGSVPIVSGAIFSRVI
jgi:hypothetical protein